MDAFDRETGAARETFCRLLAGCYYEPGQEFAEERVFEGMLAAARRVDPDLAAAAQGLGQAFAGVSLQDLLVDYARLFMGPPPPLAKPYASVWMGGESGHAPEAAAEIMKLYREGGFEIDEDFHELPDHIAAELEFLYLLIFQENQARLGAQSEVLSSVLDLRRRFLAEHLRVWSKPFLAAVGAGAETSFYRGLAGLTARFLQMEAARTT